MFHKPPCSLPLPQKHTFKTHLNTILELKNKHPNSSSEIPKKKRHTHYLFTFVLNSELTDECTKRSPC